MFAKCLSIVLALSLLHLCLARPALAQMNVTAAVRSAEKVEPERNNHAAATTTVSAKEAKFAAKVKAGIAKLGTGPEARIELKLRDKTKLKGYVSEASEDNFVVVDEKTGAATQVLYPQVKKVKGHNLSTGAVIGVGVTLAIIVTLIILYLRK